MSLTNTFEEKKEEFNKELDQLFPNSDLTITYTRKTNEVDIYGTMHPMDLYYMMLFRTMIIKSGNGHITSLFTNKIVHW